MAGLSAGLIYLVEEQPNPSSDFYILPAVSVSGLRIIRCGLADLPAAEDLDGAIVIFVRYVSPEWAGLVARVRPRLRRLVFFMDDDLLDTAASAGLPLRYRFKLLRYAGRWRNWLLNQQAELWVSTPYLARKYAGWSPRLLLPVSGSPQTDVRRVFYHGSSSHEAEIRWLRPVMETALRLDERLTFEIVGGQEVYRLYRGLPRVSVVHPMKWPAYQAFLSMPGRHIGLAPLLDLAFNRARSYTKFFDITHCGAVGIFSPDSAYAEAVDHGVNAYVVPLDQVAWVDSILMLARDDVMRASMLQQAVARIQQLNQGAEENTARLLDVSAG